MESVFTKKFKIGEVIVDPQTHLINLAGKEKRLEPKLVTLLVYLAQHAQQVISRQQITEAIWPNVIVGEESITQAIFALRNALGDDAKKPIYIETIPKKGYRFLADATAVNIDGDTSIPNQVRQSKLRLFAIATGILLIALAGFITYKQTQSSSYEIGRLLPVTKMPGAECCIAINNNRKMAFINVMDRITDIYVKDLNSGTQERITQDSWQKGTPAWLDENTLVYPRCSSSECQIIRQSLHQSPQTIYSSANYIGELTLPPLNSSQILFNEQDLDGSEFMMFDLRSGKYEKLRDQYSDLPKFIYHPAFTPDGKKLYFVNFDPTAKLMALDLANKKINLVNDQFADIKSFSFDQQQRPIIAGEKQSTMGIWLLTDSETQLQLMVRASGNEQFLFPIIAPDEKAIYYQNSLLNQDINLQSRLQNPENSEKSDNISELNSTGIESSATFSSDEQSIYFVSDRSGFAEVWRYDRNTKQTVPITHLKTNQINMISLSHDSQRFSALYMYDSQVMLGIFSIHTGELLISIKSTARPLGWSHDDNSIYAEDYSTGIPTLIRYNSETLQGTEIQKNAGLFAQDSEDGKQILFFDYEKNSLVQRDDSQMDDKVLLNMDIQLKDLQPSQIRINSVHTDLFVIKQKQDYHQLWQYPLTENSVPKKLMDLLKQSQVTAINAQGTEVLYEQQMPSTGDIMKIELN